MKSYIAFLHHLNIIFNILILSSTNFILIRGITIRVLVMFKILTTIFVSGHLPSVPLTLPSEAIARCLKTFLSCLDREGGDLANKTKSCYSEFQNCSGSIIVITRQGLLYLGRCFLSKQYCTVRS